jgi:hypothetical protein
MKKTHSIKILCICILIIVSIFVVSCSVQKSKPAYIEKEPDPPQDMYAYQSIECKEDTAANFNMSGVKMMPFIRAVFFDIDDDLRTDMIAGNKYGTLHLYKNTARSSESHRWKPIQGFFDGILAGAFSVPAVGDIDGDGRKEIAVGTGGFSSDSGRILFFKNSGTAVMPDWEEMDVTDINIGNDAALTIVDYNFDERPDIIAGNSEGKLFFFRNTSTGDRIRYARDKSYIKKSFGMYAVPSAVKFNNRVILVVGNSMGKLYLYELTGVGNDLSVSNIPVRLSFGSFASPSFTNLLKKGRYDLVISDSDGELSYFENIKSDFTVWTENRKIFNNRIFTGPASAPTIFGARTNKYMVIGNIDGVLRFFEYRELNDGLPWVERENYLAGIRVAGFSRGTLANWRGRALLITGQSSGEIRAFINMGTDEHPLWEENKNFFKGVRVRNHSTPAVFDIDGDGSWELITGAADGRIYAYRITAIKYDLPVWEQIRGVFDNIRVKGFSTPAVVHDGTHMYLFVGRQDGTINTYMANLGGIHGKSLNFYEVLNRIVFHEKDFLKDIKMNSHSSPSLINDGNDLEFVAGDYDGNIRHFMCEKVNLTGTSQESLTY